MRNLSMEINTGMNAITVSCSYIVYTEHVPVGACLVSDPLYSHHYPYASAGILSMAAYGVSTDHFHEEDKTLY